MALRTLIYKDLRLFIGDKKALLLTYMLPVVLISLFALAYGGMGSSERSPSKLMICDMDSTDASTDLIALLDSIPEISIQKSSMDEGISALKKGRSLALLCIENNYEKQLLAGESVPIQLYIDASRPIESGMMQHMIIGPIMQEISSKGLNNKIIANIKKKWPGMPEETLNSIRKDIVADMENGANEPALTISEVKPEKSVRWGLIQAVAGTAVMMLLFSVAGIGSGLLAEKESGTLRRLLLSPVSPGHILTARLIYSILLAGSQLLLMFLFAQFVFGLKIGAQWPLLLVLIFLTALSCSGFGIFLSAVCYTRKQLESLSTIIILIMSGLGGSMVPLFLLPKIMQDFAVITLNYWAIDAYYDILGRNATFGDILQNILALLLISAILVGMSYYFYFKKLKKLAL